eukprot:scaffold4562_cov255-Pinguiococcus_pyrenoidosus.AAC.15
MQRVARRQAEDRRQAQAEQQAQTHEPPGVADRQPSRRNGQEGLVDAVDVDIGHLVQPRDIEIDEEGRHHRREQADAKLRRSQHFPGGGPGRESEQKERRNTDRRAHHGVWPREVPGGLQAPRKAPPLLHGGLRGVRVTQLRFEAPDVKCRWWRGHHVFLHHRPLLVILASGRIAHASLGRCSVQNSRARTPERGNMTLRRRNV